MTAPPPGEQTRPPAHQTVPVQDGPAWPEEDVEGHNVLDGTVWVFRPVRAGWRLGTPGEEGLDDDGGRDVTLTDWLTDMATAARDLTDPRPDVRINRDGQHEQGVSGQRPMTAAEHADHDQRLSADLERTARTLRLLRNRPPAAPRP